MICLSINWLKNLRDNIEELDNSSKIELAFDPNLLAEINQSES